MKDLIKSEDDQILEDLAYYVWENKSKIPYNIYKEIMERLSNLSYFIKKENELQT